MHNPKNSLGEFMVKEADSSMREADAVVLVVDTGKEISAVEENVIAYWTPETRRATRLEAGPRRYYKFEEYKNE
jgi:GTPase Era involved in 16S rRNA processing